MTSTLLTSLSINILSVYGVTRFSKSFLICSAVQPFSLSKSSVYLNVSSPRSSTLFSVIAGFTLLYFRLSSFLGFASSATAVATRNSLSFVVGSNSSLKNCFAISLYLFKSPFVLEFVSPLSVNFKAFCLSFCDLSNELWKCSLGNNPATALLKVRTLARPSLLATAFSILPYVSIISLYSSSIILLITVLTSGAFNCISGLLTTFLIQPVKSLINLAGELSQLVISLLVNFLLPFSISFNNCFLLTGFPRGIPCSKLG